VSNGSLSQAGRSSGRTRSLVRPPTACPPKRTMFPAQKVAEACSRGVGAVPSVLGLYQCLRGQGRRRGRKWGGKQHPWERCQDQKSIRDGILHHSSTPPAEACKETGTPTCPRHAPPTHHFSRSRNQTSFSLLRSALRPPNTTRRWFSSSYTALWLNLVHGEEDTRGKGGCHHLLAVGFLSFLHSRRCQLSPWCGLLPLAWLEVPVHAIQCDPINFVRRDAIFDQSTTKHQHHVANLEECREMKKCGQKGLWTRESEWGTVGVTECVSQPRSYSDAKRFDPLTHLGPVFVTGIFPTSHWSYASPPTHTYRLPARSFVPSCRIHTHTHTYTITLPTDLIYRVPLSDPAAVVQRRLPCAALHLDHLVGVGLAAVLEVRTDLRKGCVGGKGALGDE